MDDDCNQGKDDYSDRQGRALGENCVRYLESMFAKKEHGMFKSILNLLCL